MDGMDGLKYVAGMSGLMKFTVWMVWNVLTGDIYIFICNYSCKVASFPSSQVHITLGPQAPKSLNEHSNLSAHCNLIMCVFHNLIHIN